MSSVSGFKAIGNRFQHTLAAACLAMLAVSGSAVAVEPDAWVGAAIIEIISVQPNSRIYLKLKTSTPDLGCPGNIDGWLELNTAFPNFKEQFALLLAAHSANRRVAIYVSGCGHYPYAQNSKFY